jgi:hypothetical protein
MALRHVERVEVVVRGLHLAAVDDHVAEPEEDVLDLAADLGDQVQVAARGADARERDVDALLAQAPVELAAVEFLPPRGDGQLDGLAHSVQRLPRLAVAHLAERLLQIALASEVANARVVQLLGRRGTRNRAQSLAFKRLRIHRATVPRWLTVALPAVSHPRGRPLASLRFQPIGEAVTEVCRK